MKLTQNAARSFVGVDVAAVIIIIIIIIIVMVRSYKIFESMSCHSS